MAGTKVHTRYPLRTGKSTPIANARRVLRSGDPCVTRESVIHALRTLYRHRELDVSSEDGAKLLAKYNVDKSLVTLDNPVR